MTQRDMLHGKARRQRQRPAGQVRRRDWRLLGRRHGLVVPECERQAVPTDLIASLGQLLQGMIETVQLAIRQVHPRPGRDGALQLPPPIAPVERAPAARVPGCEEADQVLQRHADLLHRLGPAYRVLMAQLAFQHRCMDQRDIVGPQL